MRKIYKEQEFISILKKNNIDYIIMMMSSPVTDDSHILSINDKTRIIADNICHLKIDTLSVLLPMYDIKYWEGDDESLYVNAVNCDTHIFGFLNSYYSVDKKTRYDAYVEAVKNNRVDILKKIRHIEPKNLEKIREYVSRKSSISEKTKSFVIDDYRKSRSKKDTSPEDYLKQKQKISIKKQLKK